MFLGDHDSNLYWGIGGDWNTASSLSHDSYSLWLFVAEHGFYGLSCCGSFYSVSKTNSTLEFEGKNFSIIESSVLDLG